MATGTVRLHRVLRAPPERVYKAFLNAEAMREIDSGAVTQPGWSMASMQNESVRFAISRRAGEAFHADAQAAPPMTLRGGNAEDSYEVAPAPDPELDRLTDAYLEAYTFWGLGYLDPASWRHYLPHLIDYAFRHMDDPKMAVEGLLHNLWPPDRSRRGSLRSPLSRRL